MNVPFLGQSFAGLTGNNNPPNLNILDANYNFWFLNYLKKVGETGLKTGIADFLFN